MHDDNDNATGKTTLTRQWTSHIKLSKLGREGTSHLNFIYEDDFNGIILTPGIL